MTGPCLHEVCVVTPDAGTAGQTFQRLFGLTAAPGGPSGPGRTGEAALTIGGVRIEFVTPAAGDPLADVLHTNGEGMAALCVEVADLAAVRDRLRAAGVAHSETIVHGRAAVLPDRAAAHGVRLTLVARS